MTDRYVLDTNVALYLLSGRLVNPLPVEEFYVSIISEIEMLSFSAIGQEEESRIRQFLSQVTIVVLSEEVKQSTIEILKKPIAAFQADPSKILRNLRQILRSTDINDVLSHLRDYICACIF
ncbi:MAG: hypothetical protein NT070_21275 [Cyanobacteria bacterium]|nr:hypothetical protein [Cyanobacteriota bacterium]